MRHKYYLIYKVTNKNSGRYYIGKHKTNKIDDGYMGSGTDIQFAILTEGKENFKKEILFVFDNEHDMIKKEKELVNEDFVASERSYNKAVAGGATWSGVRGPNLYQYPDIKSRPICPECKKYPLTVNYYRKGKPHYRSLCSNCNSAKKKSKELTSQLLLKSGYTKKKVCDRCGFISKHSSQTKLIYLDNDKMNVSRENLRTFCLNCIAEIGSAPQNKKNDLIADF